jgi:hypothetical protein
MADKDLIQEIQDHRTFAETELAEQRKEAAKDRLCVAGKIWEAMDPDAVRERKATKRPYLNSDEINQYINQVVNDVRANPRGIKYAPTANGANDAGAEFYQNHVREIEYRSKASVVYAHAFEEAVTSGVGWLRITAKREHPRTFNQDLWIEMIANGDQVLPDPNCIWSDSRDVKKLVYLEPWARSAFEQKFPKARAVNFSSDTAKLAPGWLTSDIVQVGEYWKLESIERQLVAFRARGAEPGTEQVALLDELPDGKLPAGMENVREETVEDTRVRTWLTNGLEILKEQKWSGKYIPFVSCYGKIVYIEGKRVVLSMTRLARDPAMYHAYALTCGAEAIGGVPRAQWVGYEGQFAKPDRWKQANRQPVSHLEAKPTVPGAPQNELLPLPQKQAWDPPIQNIELVIEARRRSIQAAMGISPQPTDVQRRSDISGKAWQEREAQGQKGSFHFVDAYDLMIERTGMLLEDALDKYLDTARDVPVRLAGDKADIVRINDPSGSVYNQQRQLGGDPLYTKGDYRCTVSTGPADASQREAADQFVDAMVTNLQTIAGLAGPQIALKVLAESIRLKQLGPIGDDITKLLDPPQLGADGKPLPPEVAKLLGENQHLKSLLQQAAQEKEAKVVEQQGKFQIEKYKTDATSQDKAADREVKLVVAELMAKVDRMALLLEASAKIGVRLDEHHAAAADRHHAAVEGVKDRVHEDIQQVKDRAHEHVQSALDHDRALELASHQAALAPAPEDTAEPGA